MRRNFLRPPSRRLVVCLDGTWNIKASTTNIWRIFASILDTDCQGAAQCKYYDQGVGTRWYDAMTGGAFGIGTYANVKAAYCWLTEQYRPNDEICLFGFSRGALTALSLANLIDRCGLISPQSGSTFDEAYRLYQKPGFARGTPASDRFRQNSADLGSPKPIRFLGLFDTVASFYAGRLSGEAIHVYDLPLSAVSVYHAIAIDENRRPFQSVRFASSPPAGSLHERWFAGAHGNVGGGYPFDPLALAPLEWIMTAAREDCGLAFAAIPKSDLTEILSTPERDSFQEFLYGVPSFLPIVFRKRRKIGRKVSGEALEVVDASAIARYLKYSTYRQTSKSLDDFLKRFESIDEGDFNVVQK